MASKKPYTWLRVLRELPTLIRNPKALGEALTEATVVNPWRSTMVCEESHVESGYRLVSPGSQPLVNIPRGPSFRAENGGFSINYWNRDPKRPPRDETPRVLGAWAHFNPSMNNNLPADPMEQPQPRWPTKTNAKLPPIALPGVPLQFKTTGDMRGRFEEQAKDASSV